MASGTPPPSPSASPSPLSHRHSPCSHLGSRRCGPVTPATRWKLYENPFYENRNAPNDLQQTGRQRPISARKLAASLWELQEFPVSSRKLKRDTAFSASLTSFSTEASPCSHLQQRASPTSTSGSPQDMNCSFMHLLPSLKQMDVSWNTKESVSKTPQTKEVLEVICFLNGHGSTGADAYSMMNEGPVEIDEVKHTVPPIGIFKMHEAGNQSPPDKLVRVLNRLKSLENQQRSSISLVSMLRMELEHSHARVKELEFSQQSSRKEIDSLLRRVAEERNKVRAKEEEEARAVINSLMEENEAEKKARRKLESVNRRLARDLSESSKALAKAIDGIERERKARVMMEDVCDELAKEIGHDKAEVEQLKRQHAKVREELDEERSMLQMAEAWREERAKMKLAEARLELEERNLALNKLKMEIEAFLNSHRTADGKDDPIREGEVREAEVLREAVHLLPPCEAFHISFSETESDVASSNRRNTSLEQTSECIGGMDGFNGSRLWTSRLHRSRSHGQREFCEEGSSSATEETHKEDSTEAGGGSEREYTSEDKGCEQTDASDWSGECDEGDVDEDDEEGSSPTRNSVADKVDGDEDGTDLSSDFSQGRCYRKKESPMGVNGNENITIHTDCSKYSSPSDGLGMEFTPRSKSLQASPHGANYNSMVGRSKGYRSNSLEARLLEARMESQKACPKHQLRFRYTK